MPMAPKITPITNVSQITPEYIKDSIAAHYPKEVSSKVSDLFAKTMAYDYKKKAKNLKWLFGDSPTVTLDADPEKVLASLKRQGAYGIKEILSFLDSVGATYTAKQLAVKKCTYQKQEMRITRVIDLAGNSSDLVKAILAESNLNINYSRSDLRQELGLFASDLGYSYMEGMTKSFNRDSVWTDGKLFWFKNSRGFYEALDPKDIIFTIKGGIRDYDIDRALNQIQAGSIVISMDLNDMITCSSGGVSSCMSFSGSYHNGWMNTFRADFGLIVYMKNPDDRFYKLGRQWLYLRFTKDGQVFPMPAMKFQRAYGSITQQHTQLAADFIFQRAKEAFGWNENDFDKITNGGLSKLETSLNVSDSPRAGYLDTAFDFSCPGYGMKENTLFKGQRVPFPNMQACHYTHSGASLVFDFPDALAIDGLPSHNGGFRNNFRNRKDAQLGVIPEYKIVTCSSSGKELLDVECTFVPNLDGIGGKYIETSLLLECYDPNYVAQEVVAVMEAVPEKPQEPEIVLTDEDVEDF